MLDTQYEPGGTRFLWF